VADGFESLYDDGERAIFEYAVNGQRLFADPMAVHRRLTLALGGNPNAVLEQSEAGLFEEDNPAAADEPQNRLARAAAEERLWPAVRSALGLPAFDPKTGQGVTDATCRRLLDQFVAFEAQKKTTAPASPIGPPPTGASPAYPAADSLTAPPTGCG
jgi:hypothetical protein